jgi:hypothetical protein
MTRLLHLPGLSPSLQQFLITTLLDDLNHIR